MTRSTHEHPRVSIVVAAGEGSRGLAACLEALAPQQSDRVEILVVAADAMLLERVERLAGLRGVRSGGRLAPELWRDGIDAARGDLVALTTADHVPDPTWVSTIVEAHASAETAAVGGPIALPERGVMRRAVWFLRYSGMALIRGRQDVGDLAADNVCYRRAALVRHAAAYRDGFWEPAVHRRMIASGERLRFDPSMRVKLGSAPAFGQFLLQRFRHGIRFGRWRAAGFPVATRLAAMILSPLILLVFLAKITRRALRLRGLRLQFVVSLPVLVCFVLAWSLGEAWGYSSAPWRQAARLCAPPSPGKSSHACNVGT